MGQATVDLPVPPQLDPLNLPAGEPDGDPPLPATLASADDLLSQLAGEDIDRLLAEADATPVRPSPPLVEVEPTQASIDAAATVSRPAVAVVEMPPASDPPAEPPRSEAASTAAPPAIAPATPAPIIPTSIVPAPIIPAPVFSASAPPASSVTEASAAATGDAVASAPTAADPLTSYRLDILSPGEVEEQVPPVPTPAVPAAPEPVADSPPPPVVETVSAVIETHALLDVPLVESVDPPWWLRLLRWINAPLANCPDWLRDAMGKAALLTLVNAAAVIAYVLLFRAHHPPG